MDNKSLNDRLLRLEKELDHQKTIIKHQTIQIDQLTATVLNLNRSFLSNLVNNDNSHELDSGNNPLKAKDSCNHSNRLKKPPLPDPVFNHISQGDTNYSSQIRNSRTANTIVETINSNESIPILFKRKRAIDATKKFKSILPNLGGKLLINNNFNISNKKPRLSNNSNSKEQITSLSNIESPDILNVSRFSPNLSKSESSIHSTSPLSFQAIENTTNNVIKCVNMSNNIHKLEVFSAPIIKIVVFTNARFDIVNQIKRHVDDNGRNALLYFLNQDGGRELFIQWINEEFEKNSLQSNELIYELISLLEHALWNEDIINETRYDKLIRKIYKKYVNSIENFNNKENLIILLRRIWPNYRKLYKGSDNS